MNLEKIEAVFFNVLEDIVTGELTGEAAQIRHCEDLERSERDEAISKKRDSFVPFSRSQ